MGQNTLIQNIFKNLMWDAAIPELPQAAAGMLAKSHNFSVKHYTTKLLISGILHL